MAGRGSGGDGGSAEEMLRRMVQGKPGASGKDDPVDCEADLPPPPQADPDDGVEITAEDRGKNAEALKTAIVPRLTKGPVMDMTVDSSPERGKTGRGCSISSSGSSSESRGRKRSRSAKKKKKKQRINNFSSIRNVEKEKAKTRNQRSAGAS